MRIKLTLEPLTDNASLPLNYNYPFSAMIYRILAQSSSSYADFLHEAGYQLGQKRFKFYTFSRPWIDRPQLNRTRDRLLLNGKSIVWQISSPIDDFLQNLINGLFEAVEIVLADNYSKDRFRVVQIETIAPPEITDEIRFKCLAPITVSIKGEYNGQPSKVYLRPDDERFSQLVRQNLIEKYRTLYKREPADSELNFNFDWQDIERRGGIGKVSKMIKYKDINIRGYLAPFTVTGNKELIKIGYECGFGSSNSQGFGMVEPI